MAGFFRRLRARIRHRHFDAELRHELEVHRAMAEDALRAPGAAPADVRRQAARQLGNVTRARESARSVWIAPSLESVWQDLVGGLRMLRKRPGVAAAAILSLALGIGANTAIFSLVSALLLEPLPYRDPDRLVMINAVPDANPGELLYASVPEFMAWARARSFESIGASGTLQRNLGAEDNGAPAERVYIQPLTAGLLQVLAVPPALGRPFDPNEDRVDAPAAVAILSDGLWRRRFDADERIVGRTIRLDGQVYTVIGVMPPGFSHLDDYNVDLWTPVSWSRAQVQGSARGFPVVARLKQDVTIAQAQAEMNAIAAGVARVLPNANTGWGARVRLLHEATYGVYGPPLLMLQGIVGFILLIACANVAGLLLARASERRGEIALRAAIGASRARIVRQLLTESVLFAAIGGMAGLAVGWAGLKLLVAASPGLPRMGEIAVDGTVLAFTVAVSLVTGVAFGAAPALEASRPDLIESLKASSKGASDGGFGSRLRSGLVVVEIALALILLVGSGLLINSFVRLTSNDLGADPRGVLTFEVRFPGNQFQKRVGTYNGFPLIEVSPVPAATFDRVWQRLETLPGVAAAAGVNSGGPFAGGGPMLTFGIEGRPAPRTDDGRQAMSASSLIVTPRFFETMRIPIVQGRDFDERDTSASPWVAIVSETMAKTYWPNQSPIGQYLTFDLVADELPREIVGVVRDTRSSPYEPTPRPTVYALHHQQPLHNRGPYGGQRLNMSFVVRASGPVAAVVPAIRRAMTEMVPEQVVDVALLEQRLGEIVSGPRYTMTLVAVFAAVATLLAAIGIYGVIAHGVSRRTREIGIRMALGADRSNVMGLVLRRVLVLTALGLAIGLGGTLALTRLIANLFGSSGMTMGLWGVTPTDAPTYVAVSLVMALVALAAGLVPTIRAMRIAPTVALRYE